MSFVTVNRLLALSILGLLAMSFASADIKVNEILQTPTIYIDAPSAVRIYETFTVSIRVVDVVDIWGWQVKLRWNPVLMEYINWAEGDFLSSLGETEGPGAFVRPEAGSALIGINLVDRLDSVSGNGILANVTLNCTGPGNSALLLNQTRLFNPPQSVPWNGYGDYNSDGHIDMSDAASIGHAYDTSSIVDPEYDPAADFDDDGFVDSFDLLCVSLNFGKMFPDPVLIPVDFAHVAVGSSIYQKPAFPVTWRWINNVGQDVWYTVYIYFEFINIPSQDLLENFSYAQPLDYISFDISSPDYQFCTVTIPKLFMSGAFLVVQDNFLAPSQITWNMTHTSITFQCGPGDYHFKVRGEIATKIRGLWSLSDVNGDGKVNILDLVRVAVDFGWHEP